MKTNSMLIAGAAAVLAGCATVKAAGFSFHVWTVDDPERAKKAFVVGADTLTTNRAKFILEACGK